MSGTEKKVLDFFEKNIIWFLYGFITVAALLIRWQFIDWRSPDYINYLEPWFLELKEAGGLNGLGKEIGNYNVLYLLLMALLTYIPLEPILLIKALSCFMDFLGAFAGVLLCRNMGKDFGSMTSVMIYGVLLILPNVFVNSAVWAQCDFSYTAFVMISLFFLMKDKFREAMIAFGVAFCFKLQAVFFLPVLLVYYVSKKKFSILEFLWWPIVWAMTSLPAVIMGRSINSIIRIYHNQVTLYSWMTMSYPNIYMTIQKTGSEIEDYAYFSDMALVLTFCILSIGCVYAVRKKMVFDNKKLLGISAWCAFTCVMFLPAMHERYGFLAEILVICLAFAVKNVWMYLIATLVNVVSIINYVGTMFCAIPVFFKLLLIVNIFAYICLTYFVLKQGVQQDTALEEIIETV